jgi:hypothetical protein
MSAFAYLDRASRRTQEAGSKLFDVKSEKPIRSGKVIPLRTDDPVRVDKTYQGVGAPDRL